MKTLALSVLLLAVCVPSCGGPPDDPAPPSSSPETAKPVTPLIPKVEIHDWCREHGVPESICTRCDESLIAGYKEKGDWCEPHGLPHSQCFECRPELEAEFRADMPPGAETTK